MAEAGFIIPLVFDGVQRFQDPRHATNFVRYMFSQSKGNPEEVRTKLNLLTEYSAEGDVLSQKRNETPAENCKDFLARRLPADADEILVNDGAYILFVVELDDGRVVSNCLRQEGHALKLVGDEILIREGIAASGGLDTFLEAVDRASGLNPVLNLDDVEVEAHEEADRFVQNALAAQWPARTLLMVSHHDQREAPAHWHTNPFYHVHRLRMREDGE